MKKLHLIGYLVLAVLLINFSPSAAKAGEKCVWKLELIANGTVLDTTLKTPYFKTSEAGKLKIKISSPNTPDCKNWTLGSGQQILYRGTYVKTPPGGSAGTADFITAGYLTPKGNELSYTQTLGGNPPDDTIFTYIIDQGINAPPFNPFSGEQKRIVIQFNNSQPSSMPPKGGGSGSGNTNVNTNTATNTNTNTSGPPNSAINTSIGGKFELGLDEKIGDFFNPLEKNTLPQLLATLLRILFMLIGMVAVVIIIISGFRMVMASGNETELTKAKQAITWAVVGLIVALMSFSIVAIVQRLIQG